MEKLSVRVSADSTCDLSPELLQAYGIETLPLYVVMDGNAYKDGLELTPDELYAKVREAGKIGSTAAINVNEYLTFFTRMKESCDTLIHHQQRDVLLLSERLHCSRGSRRCVRDRQPQSVHRYRSAGIAGL